MHPTGDVGNALTTAFHQSGYEKRVNCTVIRKTIVTYTHEYLPDKKGQFADHMLHRFGTADKYYKVRQKSRNTMECTNTIREVINKSVSTGIVSIPAASAGSELDLCTDVVSKSPLVNSRLSSAEHCPYKKKIKWSKENRDMIENKFSVLVKQECAHMENVREILYSDPEFVKKLESEMKLSGYALERTVRDKVRIFYRKKYGYLIKKR